MKNLDLHNDTSNSLSVIVACYNVSEYLKECLDSLVNQTFKNIEVIMIDDCSDDDTASIIDEYAQLYPNFTAIHNEQNLGPSASRNKGIDLANGDWLTFVDGDDIVPSEAYDFMIASLIKSQSQLVTGFVRRFDKTRNKPSFLHKKAIIDGYQHTVIADHPELLYDTTSWNKVYSTNLLRQFKIKFPTDQIYEDVAFTLNAFLHSNGIDIITNTVYNWRWRDSSNASFTQVKNELPKYLDRLKSLEQVKSLLLEASLWHGELQHQLIFKLLDMDIPLFMDDIADADEAFIHAFQEETIKFFRKWDLLDSPIIKKLSAKKQYQYYALIQGNFKFLKMLSYGHPLTGKIAEIERKNLGLPTFNSPKALNVKLTKINMLDSSLNFKGIIKLGKKSLRRFPNQNSVVNAELININTKKKIKLSTFKRSFTLLNFHLKRTTAPASRFDLSIDLKEAVRVLGIGTYKIKLSYREHPGAPLLSVFLGQPQKGAGSLSTLTSDDGSLSVTYGYNTIWETALKVIPTSELAIGSVPTPTVVNDIMMDQTGSLTLQGTTDEKELVIELNNQVLPCSISNHHFSCKLDSDTLKQFLNNSAKLQFKNPLSGINIIPNFDVANTIFMLNSSKLSIAVDIKLGKGIWIKPDVPLVDLINVKVNKISNQTQLEFETTNPLTDASTSTQGKIELLSTDLVNRYLNAGTATILNNQIVGKIQLGDDKQLNVLSGKYQLYLNLADPIRKTNQRFKISGLASTELEKQIAEINRIASTTIFTDRYNLLRLNIKQSRPWIDRTKVRRGLAYSVLYPLARLLPLEKKTVIFESLWGQSYNDSPRAMYEYLVEKHPDMKFVWVLKNEQTPVDDTAIRVRRMSFKYWYYMARAKYLVQNTNLPNQYSKRKNQIEVETLHGTFMKVMGFDEPHFKNASNRVQANFAKRINRWDLMSVPSDFMFEHGSTAFDYPEQKILKTGFPRTDELIHNNHPEYLNQIKTQLNIPIDKKIALYAPTYRTTDEAFNFQLDLDAMQQKLGDEYVLLVRLHYFVSHSQNFVDQAGFVYDVSDYGNINDLYLISDVLITDYSSVMFDFGYLKKPMIFFAYDKDWYLDPTNRGIYLDYDATVPGPVAMDTDDVINGLQNIDQLKVNYADKLNAFYDKFCQFGRNGDASERFSEAMLNLQPESQDSVVHHLIWSKVNRLLKLNNAQSKLLNYLGQVLPKNSKIAMFESFFGRQYSDNPKGIYEYMKINYPEMKLYWNVNKDYEQYFIDNNIPYVRRFSFKGIWIQARAKYWFTNVRRPFRWFKPKDTVVVQTWHGTPLKTIGTDVQQVTMPGVTRMKYHKQVIRDSARWDYLLAPNPYSYEIMQRAFRKQYPQMLPTGYPRNDRLSNATQADINAIKQALNISPDTKLVLYAPTWRDNDFVRADHYRAELHLNLNRFIQEVPENTKILIRTHYLISNNLDLSDYGDRVINVSDYADITDLYLISDILITDYSSVFFDYATLKRPMIFFAYDLKAYAEDIRGFYVDYHSTVPGPIVQNNDDLMPIINQALLDPQKFIDNQQYNDFLTKFASWEDGHSVERLLNTVLNHQDAYLLQDVEQVDQLTVGSQVQLEDATILWSGIPGLPDSKFIKNFDDSTSMITVNRIATLVPRDFANANLYTGGEWINAKIDDQDVWFSIKNVK